MSENAVVKAANGGTAIQREEFGATQLQVVRETAAAAVAAREKAAVEARYIMAMNRPRSLERARQQLLSACSNKDFAESSWYRIPNRGEGFTIRFAEEALRCFGNVFPETMIVYENDQIRMIRVTVTDLESNLSYSSEIIVQKTVERKRLREGQAAIAERINSNGDKVYLVEATEEDITVKQNAMLSKAIRTAGLRLIPSWIALEAKRAIFATLEGAIKKDPASERRRVIDAFAQLGITVRHLEQYFSKAIDATTPADILLLKPIYTALKDNETTWDDVMAARQPSEEEQHGSKEAAQRVAEEKLRKLAGENKQAPEADSEPEDKDLDASKSEAPKGQNRGFTFGGARR